MGQDIPALVRWVLQQLEQAGYQGYLVGGCVRDLLRNAIPQDWDICTSARPEEIEQVFSGCPMADTGRQHGTITVLAQGGPYEITTFRVDGEYSDGRRPDAVRFVSELEADLARRDFTVNAMAMDGRGRIYDPFGGQADLRAGVIRCVGTPERRFQEDALRVMRGIRFCSVLGFSMEAGTAQGVHACRRGLERVAAERIRQELTKLLQGPDVGRVLREFADVLWVFWPELEQMVGVEQHNPWHRWDVWEHTVRAVECVPPDLVLRLTMLLHDLGKPVCRTTDREGIDHFYGHQTHSARMAGEMLERLRFDRRTKRQVVELVTIHDERLRLEDGYLRHQISHLGVERWHQLLTIQRADRIAQGSGRSAAALEQLEQIARRGEALIQSGSCLGLKELDIDGNHLLAAGVPAGAAVGEILRRLLDLVLEGRVANRRGELLQAARQLYPLER
ncbi:MAG TPA: tRNA nucleotidyltransferase [Clostridiales bacterium]|nr:tRNA nucleotidyltransferase [Clostridiales bacterium]